MKDTDNKDTLTIHSFGVIIESIEEKIIKNKHKKRYNQKCFILHSRDKDKFYVYEECPLEVLELVKSRLIIHKYCIIDCVRWSKAFVIKSMKIVKE